MNEDSKPPSYQSSANTGPNMRLRSVPYRGPFVLAGILGLINFCGAVAILTTLVLYLTAPSQTGMKMLVGTVVFFFIASIASFLKRRNVLCPLCKGTPLVNSRARAHPKAFRVFPLDYGTSSMLSLLFTQTFRCLYCGAKFDLLKPRPERKISQTVPRHDNLS